VHKEQAEMNINRNLIGIAAVAAAAYVAGELGVLTGGAAGAWAQAEPEEKTVLEQIYRKIGTPGPHQKVLEQMAGEWDAVFEMWMEPGAAPLVSTGTISREMIFGGRYLKEVVKASSEAGPFEGLGFVAYNNYDGRFESVWMDSESTGIYMEAGTYHPDEKILHMASDRRDPASGRVVHSWGKLDMSDPDRHVYTGHSTDAEGRTYTQFKGVAERRKSS
jgi:hypothetical protein